MCRLLDFSVVDKAGEQQPLESHGVQQTELFLSGQGSAQALFHDWGARRNVTGVYHTCWTCYRWAEPSCVVRATGSMEHLA